MLTAAGPWLVAVPITGLMVWIVPDPPAISLVWTSLTAGGASALYLVIAKSICKRYDAARKQTADHRRDVTDQSSEERK